MLLTKSKRGAIGAMAVQSGNRGTAGHALFAGQPRGLSTLFFTELWERFSYYGMRALLTLFIVAPVAAGGLGLKTVEAARIYGNYTMAVYLLSIPGGFMADRFLGAHRAVLVGGIVIALGHFTLAVPALATFYVGLALVALGTGLFKPNISAMVGGLYGDDDERRDAGFSIFYMGINVGAFSRRSSPASSRRAGHSATADRRLGLDPTDELALGLRRRRRRHDARAHRLPHAAPAPRARGRAPARPRHVAPRACLVVAGTLGVWALAVPRTIPRSSGCAPSSSSSRSRPSSGSPCAATGRPAPRRDLRSSSSRRWSSGPSSSRRAHDRALRRPADAQRVFGVRRSRPPGSSRSIRCS